MSSILKTLAWELDKNFRPPFIDRGVVEVNLSDDEKRLSIRILNRDIEIDETGKVIASGTRID